MKFLHIADLHIGKRVNEFNMIEDQKYILEQLISVIESEKPKGIIIAGDVYDKSQPSGEAVELFDDFLTKFVSLAEFVFIISGNHDSPERLSFGSRILKKSGLYIAGVFDGKMNKITLKDEYGPLHVYLLPFVKPAVVRAYYEEEIESYNDAVNVIISNEKISMDERNILVAHQFVTSGGVSPERSDSENISLGGLDNVDASLFRNFDYVALGHIHRPQKIGRDEIRYAGSPLKYSFSEARHHKSVTVLEIKEKGNVKIDLIPLLPLRDLREIKGPINELIKIGKEDYKGSTDYIHATITDEDEIYDALGKLRQVYPNIMILDFDNKRSRSNISFEELSSEKIESKSPLDLFEEFYEAQNNKKLSEEEIKIIERLLEKAGGIEI